MKAMLVCDIGTAALPAYQPWRRLARKSNNIALKITLIPHIILLPLCQ